MSRTKRNLPPNGRWLRKVRTFPLIKNKTKAEQEIKEELGQNYLGGNFSGYKNIPTYWDDKYISAYDEYIGPQDINERLFSNEFPELESQKISIEFRPQTNTFYLGRKWGYWRQEPGVYLIPFIFRIKDKVYPVCIKQHRWRHL